MKKFSRALALICAAVGLAFLVQTISFAQKSAPVASKLTMVHPDGTAIHIFPTVREATRLGMLRAGRAGSQLTYHPGGSVMQPTVNFFIIYWAPSQLQTGAATSIPANYRTLENALVGGYGGHSLSSITTQYYQSIGGPPNTYITGNGALVSTYFDTHPYPASGCTDTARPGNCITDAQLRTEIERFMGTKGLTGGLDRMYLVFTSTGEGSCFDAGSASCAYTQYCAYHGSFTPATGPDVVYSNEPYGDSTVCLGSGTSPNSFLDGDSAATTASHEITEAITDPFLNAWFDSSGSEIGDKCAYNYGTNTWDSGQANQKFGPKFFELQQEWNNHTAGCSQSGP